MIQHVLFDRAMDLLPGAPGQPDPLAIGAAGPSSAPSGPGTAAECRRRARPAESKSAKDRDRVLAAIVAKGDCGLTDFEVACELVMPQDTARARRNELMNDGLVVDSGERRPSPTGRDMTVWTAAAVADRHGPDHGARDHQARAVDRPGQTVCRTCGCEEYVDVPVHGGRSVRRDCRKCGGFVAFVRWNGRAVE